MMTRTSLLLALCCCATLAACSSTNPKGDRYRYPDGQVGNSKTVRFTSTDGRFVGLSDGSLWNIDWSASGAAKALRPGEAVTVQKAGGGSFPYRLSPANGRPVRARYGKKLD